MTHIFAFWLGGLLACMGHIAMELIDGVPKELQLVLRRSVFARVGAMGALLLMLVLWPAGIALLCRQKLDAKKRAADELAEWERIEATRRPPL
jgi:hypothetical protein